MAGCASQTHQNYISYALSGELPDDLMARTGQSITVEKEPDQVYQDGKYWLEDYLQPLRPALTEAETAWSEGLLRDAGLI